MTFRDDWEQYKNHELPEAETAKMEEEIEKTKLILEHLEEQEAFDIQVEAEEWQEEGELKEVRKTLKKRSLAIMLSTLGLVVLCVLLVQFVAIPLADQFYYNPGVYQEDKFEPDFTIGMSAYTELHFPGEVYSNTQVEKIGIGKYRLLLSKYTPYTTDNSYYMGTIDKNEFVAEEGRRNPIAINHWKNAVYSGGGGILGGTDKITESLNAFPSYASVTAALSFRRDLTMDELADLRKRYESETLHFLWAGIRNAPYASIPGNEAQKTDFQRLPITGFEMTAAGMIFEKINEQYDAFEMGDILYGEDDADIGDAYERHFTSLLKYMIDHREFRETILGVSPDVDVSRTQYYKDILEFVKEFGTKTYGILVVGSAEEILKLQEESDVCQTQIIDVDWSYQNY